MEFMCINRPAQLSCSHRHSLLQLHLAMADPHPVLGIDLNVPGSENDPEEDAQGLGQPVVQVYTSNPIDWDQVARGFFFIWATHIFSSA